MAVDAEILLPNTLNRKDWAGRIDSEWRGACEGMLESIFQIGRHLKEARASLPHGQFIMMINEDLPFSRQTANKFMKIERDKRLSNDALMRHLPPNWGTLYKITRLSDGTLERLLEEEIINPECTYSEINKILRLEKVKTDEERVLNLQPRPGKYRTLVIDPAWEYDWLSLAGRAKPGYAMQTLEQLRALDLKQWANDECHLYCWVTNNFMYEAGKLIDGWGFQHRTIITWIKPPPFGLGSYFRNSTEHVIFATLGDTTTRHAAASLPTHFTADRLEHSEKPEEFYEIVRAASYPPFGEGNQRRPRPDFTDLFEEVKAAA